MRRRRRSFVFWLVVTAILLVNYVIVRWLAPSATGPAVSGRPALSAPARLAISAPARPAVSAAAPNPEVPL